MKVRVRFAGPQEIDRLAEYFKEFYERYKDEDWAGDLMLIGRDELDFKKFRFLIAEKEDDDKIVGCFALYFDEKGPRKNIALSNISVLYFKKGIGTKLLEETMRVARGKKIKVILAFPHLQPGISFLEKHGFDYDDRDTISGKECRMRLVLG